MRNVDKACTGRPGVHDALAVRDEAQVGWRGDGHGRGMRAWALSSRAVSSMEL